MMGMKLIDAIYLVLSEANVPMHYREIWDHIRDRKLWVSTAQDPAATVNAYMASDIRMYKSRSRFRRIDAGVYRANPSPDVLNETPATTPGWNKLYNNRSSSDYANAAERILQRYAARGPLVAERIAELALRDGFISTHAQTPGTTMRAAIRRDIEKRRHEGRPPRFIEHDNGRFSLVRTDAATPDGSRGSG